MNIVCMAVLLGMMGVVAEAAAVDQANLTPLITAGAEENRGLLILCSP